VPFSAQKPRLRLVARDGDLRVVLLRHQTENYRARWQPKQTYAGLARTKRVHQIEKPRIRPFTNRISEQSNLQGIDVLRGPLKTLRFPHLS
jgi:hypothetical protein